MSWQWHVATYVPEIRHAIVPLQSFVMSATSLELPIRRVKCCEEAIAFAR